MGNSDRIQPSPHLCQLLGFDAKACQARLDLMELGEADIPVLQQINQEVIRPHAEDIMLKFYDFLLGFAEIRGFLGTEDRINRLHVTQLEYLSRLGVDFHDIEYFEYRLRVGMAHERIGMPLYLFLAAYRSLQSLIQAAMPPALCQPPSRYATYISSLGKIVALDISLVIDAYTRSRSEIMQDSLMALVQERDVLTSQLMHDTLTGTLSRRFILETLSKQLAQLSRNPQRQLSIALLDLDHFKRVNDSYGHLVGDKVLYEFCRVVSTHVREQDYFGRFGGEEFLLILTEIHPEQALQVLHRIRESTQTQVFTHDGQHIPLTVSIGFTTAIPEEKVDDLIERADNALYAAKSAGRNQIVSL